MSAVLFFSGAAGAQSLGCSAFERTTRLGSSRQKLNRFIDLRWKYLMQEYPEWASYVGRGEGADRWTDVSLAAIQRRKEMTACFSRILKGLSPQSLKGQDQVNYDLLVYQTEQSLEGLQFESEYLVMDHLGGLHLDLPETLSAMPTANLKDYENMILRLEKVPVLASQHETLLREGLKRKITPVKMFLGRVSGQFEKVLTKDPKDSPLFEPFKDIRAQISDEQKKLIQSRALKVIQESVYPALSRLRDFVVNDYIPGARESISMKDLPKGSAWYAYSARAFTTTPQPPEELHRLGLKEVERITAAMLALKERLKFKGDLKAFNNFLLTDKRFYFSDKEQLLTAYRDAAKRVDPELPKFFKTLPRLPYGVREIPEYKAKESSAAYYSSGNLKSGRPGYFEANTFDLKARPKWAIEVLTLHEAVPGHHLQIALAQEIEDLPDFRKYGGNSAFSEGWGLYAESLGEEMGFYKDDYSKYGQLTYEMWRAVRLVVDTGIHHYGWSRDQAIQYFMEQMPKSRTEAEVEIDRYITWPGQALAYKVGQLKIQELRQFSRDQLGERFDLRAFHDVILRDGALPLAILEKNVHAWVKESQRPAASR